MERKYLNKNNNNSTSFGIMKREYVKPELDFIQLEGEVLMFGGSNFTPNNGDSYEGDDAGSRGRHGSWGDLWSSEE